MTPARPRVILAPGALYLFWTTGVFYVFELVQEYDVVLVVNEEYRRSEAFTALLEQQPAVRACFVPNVRPVRRLHRFYATEIRRLVEEVRPRFVLSNDIWGMEMLYLFHFARLQQAQGDPCFRIAIQASNVAKDFDKDIGEGRKIHAGYYARKYHLPDRVASWLVSTLIHTFRVLNVFVYPTLYGGAPHRRWKTVFPVSPQRDSEDKFDAFLYYTDAEGAVLRRVFAESCRFHKVVHPLRSHEEAARALLHAGPQADAIIILPSYMSVLMMSTGHGMTEAEAIAFLANRWVEIIGRLRARFPSHVVRWKIHPGAARDPHWLAVTERVKAAVADLDVRDPAEKAEKLMFESHVIAGDVSTSLPWAAVLPGKVVISFDVFGVKHPEMEGRENIWYFDDLDGVDHARFDRPPDAGPAAGPGTREVPTVSACFAQLASAAPPQPAGEAAR